MGIDADKLISQAITNHQKGNFQIAEDLYRKILLKNPDNSAVHVNLGVLLNKLDKTEEAEKCFKSALKFNPNLVQAHINLGGIYHKLNRPKEAADSFYKAVKIEPESYQGYFNLGIIFDSINKSDQALINYNRAIEINPGYAEAYNNIANLYRNLKNKDEAEKNFNKLIQLRPRSSQAYFNRGNLYNDFQNLEKALLDYNKAVTLNPNFTLAYNLIGVINYKLLRHSIAIENYKKAISLKENFEEAHYNLGTLFNTINRLDEALECFKKAIFYNSDYFECYNNIGIIYEKLGKLTLAEKSYKKAIELNPNFIVAYYNLSQIKTFKSDDQLVSQMKELILDKSLDTEKSCYLNFALAKAQEDLKNYESSFNYYSNANIIFKKNIQYDINQDVKIFDQIKNSYSKIKENSIKLIDYSNDPRIIFILGMPRSGTTLVEQIISSHSEVTGGGELSFVENFGIDIATGKSEIDYKNLLNFRKKYLDKIKFFFNKSNIVTDKMTINFRFLGLILSAFPEAKIIHTIRSPSATCWANFRQLFTSKSSLQYSYDLDDIVTYYKLYFNLMQFWNKELGNKFYNLDYEELTINQEAETKKLINYLDLKWDEKCLNPEKNDRSVSTASNKQIRQKIFKGSSQKWKKYEKFLHGKFEGLDDYTNLIV